MQIIYNKAVEDFEYKSPERGSSSESSSSDDGGNTKTDAKADSKQPSSVRDVTQGKERSSWFATDADKAGSEQPSIYNLFEQRADPNPPLENLAPDEQALVADEISDIHLDAASHELAGTEPGSPAEAAAIAGATFNEAVRERLDNGEEPSAGTLDAAMKDTADIMGLDAAEIPNQDPPELVNQEGNAEAELDELDAGGTAEDTEPTLGTELEPDSEVEPNPDTESEPDPGPDSTPDPPDQTPPPPPSPPGGSPPAPPMPPGTPPPVPGGPGNPTPGGPGGPGSPPPAGPGGFGPAVPAAAVAPLVPWVNPNIARALNTANVPHRHRHWPYVLAGGVVGYLIGRRRGRIKTEKKLKPVQQKLERQVGDLQFQLALREAKVRKLAYEKAISHPHIHAALPKRLKELQELQQAKLASNEDANKQSSVNTAERSETRSAESKHNKKIEKVQEAGLAAKIIQMTERERPAPDESKVSNGPNSPARLSELRNPDETEQPSSLSHLSSTGEIAPVKDMPIHDILTIAEQLPIEDKTLRTLYETGRISQRGLRRVIEEYLRGGRYDRVLWEELQTNESIHEPADSSLSDIHESGSMSTHGDAGATTNKATESESPEAARMQPHAWVTDDDTPHSDSKRTMLTIAVAAVGVIAIIVLIILFT